MLCTQTSARLGDNRVTGPEVLLQMDGSASVGCSAQSGNPVSLKIQHAHTESAELRPPNLARLHIYLVARRSPIFSLIGQQEVALKNEVVSKTFFFVTFFFLNVIFFQIFVF